MKNNLTKFSVLILASVLCLISVDGVNSQTKRRVKNGAAKPTATPVTNTSLIIPEVVRRAEDNEVISPDFEQTENGGTENSEDVDSLKNKINELNDKIKTLESENKIDAEAKQKKLLLSLDILAKAEQRSELLNKQLFELIEKENTVKSRIDQINYDMRPEMIDRNAAFAGSLRPEDVRDARQKSLQSEKTNLQSLLIQLEATRSKLELSVQRAEYLVEKIRLKFEKEIDDALTLEETETPQ